MQWVTVIGHWFDQGCLRFPSNPAGLLTLGGSRHVRLFSCNDSAAWDGCAVLRQHPYMQSKQRPRAPCQTLAWPPLQTTCRACCTQTYVQTLIHTCVVAATCAKSASAAARLNTRMHTKATQAGVTHMHARATQAGTLVVSHKNKLHQRSCCTAWHCRATPRMLHKAAKLAAAALAPCLSHSTPPLRPSPTCKHGSRQRWGPHTPAAPAQQTLAQKAPVNQQAPRQLSMPQHTACTSVTDRTSKTAAL